MLRLQRIAFLGLLYFVQGMPFGVQATALPTHLRAEGMSLTSVGLLGALSIPWLFKFLWAPLVDRAGRRRSWIIGLQVGLTLLCLGLSQLSAQEDLQWLVAGVLLMNLFAATQDIAVDGWAVDLARGQDLGPINAMQVVGYKVGMLTGGGLLVWALGDLAQQFAVMAAIYLVSTLLVTVVRGEPEREGGQAPSVNVLFGYLKDFLQTKGAIWVIVAIASYKLGESMADTMFRPYLFDLGFTLEDVGRIVGTWGMLASLLGSALGGYLAVRRGVRSALVLTAVLRVAPLILQWSLTLITPTEIHVAGVTVAESFFGGALTTAMFAFMMEQTDHRMGASHFTLFASIEVWGKLPSSWLSGWLADHTNYSVVFALAVILSALYVPLLRQTLRLRPVPEHSRTEPTQ